MVVCLLAIFVVISSYIFGLFQPVRWPSLVLFGIALFVTLISNRWAIYSIIFSLPLLPGLSTQLSYIKSPAVPYFINYPSIDIVLGYTIGLFALQLADRSTDLKKLLPPWPAGLVLLVTSASTVLAVSRNLLQTHSDFSVLGLFNNVLRFKLIDRLNDYFPTVDLLVYAVAILFFTLLLQSLKQSRDANAVVFRPLLAGAGLSALWGIMQATTSFGLPQEIIEYRPAGFGYGAIGFQPDIHAFGAHMLVGTVGFFGVLSLDLSRTRRASILVVIGLCCVALILSKSRASAVLFMFATGAYIFFMLRRATLTPRTVKLLSIFCVIALVVGFTQSFAWLKEINAALENSTTSWYQKLNQLSRYRLDIFIAAARMFTAFPFFGIGNGNFLRISRNQELTGTTWFIAEGGENAHIDIEGGDNAHNYFLQTLAEMGAIGFLVCGLFFIYPIISRKVGSQLKPVLWAMVAIALGNIYSHSLIIRDNLFLLAVFAALLYTEAQRTPEVVIPTHGTRIKYFESLKTKLFICLASLIICGLTVKEIRSSLINNVFTLGEECWRPTQVASADGWSSGIYKADVPAGARQIHLFIDELYGATSGEKRTVHFAWYNQSRRLLEQTPITLIVSDTPMQISAPLPNSFDSSAGLLTAVLSYKNCYTPGNHSFVDDHRRLAFKVRHSVEF